MLLEEKIISILEDIKETVSTKNENQFITEETAFLKGGEILCLPRKNGESRFPYTKDGLTLWCHSTGTIFSCEGVFNVFRPVHTENESPVNFFVGIPQSDGTYFPLSVLGGCRQLFEPFNVKRYLVYSLSAAYYITDTDFATFAVRANVAKNKDIQFSFCVINKTQNIGKYYLATYFEPLLKNGGYDDMWARNTRTGYYKGDGKFLLRRKSDDFHALGINRKITGLNVTENYHTVARTDFLIYQERNISNAESLKIGKFEIESDSLGKINTPIASEIIHFESKPNTFGRIDFALRTTNIQSEMEHICDIAIDPQKIDKEIELELSNEITRFNALDIKFSDWKGNVNPQILNTFIKYVQKQVDHCAMGKNYVEHLIGTRDVFQQLEQALLWDPSQARSVIIRSLSYIDIHGRGARQFSIPQKPGALPKMDLQFYVDQGLWIISTVYYYLAFTNDFTILDELCGFLEFVDEGKNIVRAVNEKSSVLDHIIRVADFLDSCLDREDGTYCLKAHKGDWNDAIDGLGKTTDEGKKYGTGVTVMGTLQYYNNLKEISEILTKVGGYEEKVKYYISLREKVKNGILENTLDRDDNGNIRIIHGWGDHKSYKVGSFCDVDGKSRTSFAPNAFWAISGMIYLTPEFKPVIMKEFLKLDSPYGIKTNTPVFERGTTGIGRMTNTVPGTAENGCAYVHASMFSILAMFLLGESKIACEQLEKSITIAHKDITKSPFVFSNSYCVNEEEGIKGYSAIDWFTGSGTAFVKNVVRGVFGIWPTLDGVKISMGNYMPCNKAEMSILLKNKNVKIIYQNESAGNRAVIVDGEKANMLSDDVSGTPYIFLKNEEIRDGMTIKVTD